MSTFYTTFLTKSDFSFALLLVTFEPLDIQQSYIPLLKALMCGINAVGAQGSGSMFTLRHAPLKMAVLLHKTEKAWDSFSETVIQEAFQIDISQCGMKIVIRMSSIIYIL